MSAQHDEERPRPKELLEEYFRRRERGEPVDFETFVAAHPEDALALRGLYSLRRQRQTVPNDPDSTMGAQLGSSPDLDPEIRAGSEIGNYRLKQRIAEGGFGIVFLAEQLRPIRRPSVAFKAIKRGAQHDQLLLRFEIERQTLARMDHVNIASIFDAGTSPSGTPYFVMEYVEGTSITAYCDEQRLPVTERLHLFHSICEAVHHAHQKAILHRDLKPSNILVKVTAEGHAIPKVIDFGLAKALEGRLSEDYLQTQTGVIVGTPLYMSPEQLAGEEALDVRIDVYALGVVLYELLVGALPFDPTRFKGAALLQIQQIKATEDPPLPRSRLARLGPEARVTAENRSTTIRALTGILKRDLDWIIVKAIDRDPEKRYATAAALAADIERTLDRRPVLARRWNLPYVAGKLVSRYRNAVLVGCLLLFGLAFAGYQYLGERARYRGLLREGRAAVQRRDLKLASDAVATLQRVYGTSDDIVNLSEAVRRLNNDLRIAESAALRRDAEQSRQIFEQAGARLDTLRTTWKRLKRRRYPETTLAVWERKEELTAWNELRQYEGTVNESFETAIRQLQEALTIAPEASEERMAVRHALADLYRTRYREAELRGIVELHPSYLRSMIELYDTERYEEDFEGHRRVSVSSDPPGATVYCFRFQDHPEEIRKIPRPFCVDDGTVVGDEVLHIERVWDETLCRIFRAEDRLLCVGSQTVDSRSDVADVLASVGEDQEIPVEILRNGNRLTLGWTPYPSRVIRDRKLLPAGVFRSAYRQFGFTFAGYPLDCSPQCRLCVTTAAGPQRSILPQGSYLLVFAAEGYHITRLPLLVGREDVQVNVRLFKDRDIPEGFVHIPAGPLVTGRDREAEQPLSTAIHEVGDFFIGKTEVTAAQWAAFLSDPYVFDRTDPDGRADPCCPELLKRAKGRPFKIRLVYKNEQGRLYFARDGTAHCWRVQQPFHEQGPALGINQYAAMEYAHWRTTLAPGPWKFRLPKDVEWEKAASGADARIHVWGDYFNRNFCWSRLSILGGLRLPVAVCPFDESVYGVRDLAGSALEPTSDRTIPGDVFISFRGGSYGTSDEQYFHNASRNGISPGAAYEHSGLRLVAEMIPEVPGEAPDQSDQQADASHVRP